MPIVLDDLESPCMAGFALEQRRLRSQTGFNYFNCCHVISERKGKQDWTLSDCEKPMTSSSEHSRTHMTEKRYAGKDCGKHLSCKWKNGESHDLFCSIIQIDYYKKERTKQDTIVKT